jgi:copper transport protein
MERGAMSAGVRVSGARWATVALALLMITLVGATGASAHPDHISTSPKDGSALSSAPRNVVVKFSEAVTMAPQGARIIDGSGAVVPSSAIFSNKNKTLTIIPKKPLGKGRYAAAYNVTSVEKHYVPGAIAFTVATPTVKGAPITIKPTPNVPTTLDGNRPGVRTISVATSLRNAEVIWRSPSVPEPMIWLMKGNGSKASGTGVLPIAGTWSFEINLSSADSILIPKGQVTLR